MDPTQTTTATVDEVAQIGLTADRFGVLVVAAAIVIVLLAALLVSSWARR